ncbi:MAG: hypothetical protein AAFY59_12270 [Pseudomonadota bacterium]
MKPHALALILAAGLAQTAGADTRAVLLEDGAGERIHIATLEVDRTGGYTLTMEEEPFTDHFLSMRPFKCLEGPGKHWCHLPYPYEIARSIAQDYTDLEYDFLFIWKGATEYGINMWNGIYYRIEAEGDALVGVAHEMDMDLLSAPPDTNILRPVRAQDVIETDPASHWLPRLVIE